MKKYILILAVVFVLPTCLYAQKIGIRGGYQAAYTNNDGSQVGGSLDSFFIGLFKNNKLGDQSIFQINTGLEYMQNGWQTSSNNFRRIHYISIPVGLRLKLGPIYAQAGPNFNFRVAEKYQVVGFDALTDDNKTNFFDLPLHLGVGFKIAFLNADLRYHWGLLDVNQGNKNSYLQVGLGVSF